MAEYGQGVGQATGVAGGSGGAGGGTTDIGAGVAAFVRDTTDTLAALPPEALVAIVIAIFLGLVILRRAF
jgi:hypothetical protein